MEIFDGAAIRRRQQIQTEMEILLEGIENRMAPFKAGSVEVYQNVDLLCSVIRIRTLPYDRFVVDSMDYFDIYDPRHRMYKLADDAGLYFASLRETTPENCILGEE